MLLSQTSLGGIKKSWYGYCAASPAFVEQTLGDACAVRHRFIKKPRLNADTEY